MPGIGPSTCHQLLENFAYQPQRIFSADLPTLTRTGLTKEAALALLTEKTSDYLADLAWLEESPKHHIITYTDPHYPQLLKEINSAPPVLFIKGQPETLNSQPSFSMVGSRKATTLGKDTASHLAQELAQAGFSIVSGLAHGIDAQAHLGALSSGVTLSVMAHGLDMVYPREHRSLSSRIIEHGALISEFPIHIKPLPNFFPRRNRIISGLSWGTLVVEAALKSGSLISAKYALEQNREVFAVPGPVNSRQSQGCHNLIQQGAKLVTGITDILEEFPQFTPSPMPSNSRNNALTLGTPLADFLEFIEPTPMTIDQIVSKSGLTPDKVSSMLTQLEVSGHVQRGACGQYTRSAME